MDPVIEVEGLRKVYRAGRGRTVEALAGVDLAVGRGEIFGLLGPNGAGKTTLIKVLLGIVRPTSGVASLLGFPVGTEEPLERVGFLPEGHRFPPYLTGMQVLQYYAELAGVEASVARRRGGELLERFSMTPWADTKIRKYSKGMMQRVGLAQALVNDPDVLFLDEPTDGVDPGGRKIIRDMLVELRSRGKTLFINSHLLMEVEMVCDRVAILDRGRIVRVGTVEELTPSSLRYRVEVSPEPALEDLVEIEGLGSSLTPEKGGFVIELRSREDTSRLIASLQAKGYQIDALAPEKPSLEDVFLDLVSGEGSR